jgi:hypothetical protein
MKFLLNNYGTYRSFDRIFRTIVSIRFSQRVQASSDRSDRDRSESIKLEIIGLPKKNHAAG